MTSSQDASLIFSCGLGVEIDFLKCYGDALKCPFKE